jgi:hypothetical protein
MVRRAPRDGLVATAEVAGPSVVVARGAREIRRVPARRDSLRGFDLVAFGARRRGRGGRRHGEQSGENQGNGKRRSVLRSCAQLRLQAVRRV